MKNVVPMTHDEARLLEQRLELAEVPLSDDRMRLLATVYEQHVQIAAARAAARTASSIVEDVQATIERLVRTLEGR